MQIKIPTLLIILDGWGIAAPSRGNAITLAKKPCLDELFSIYPSTTLGATGQDVGLEDNKMSGSESGHLNIGAGRIVKQDSAYISESIKDGSFFMNPAIVGAINHIKESGGNLHIMGLMGNSDSPHSDPDHFKAILHLAKTHQVSKVFCHFFTDGRDSYPQSALEHLKHHQDIIKEEKLGEIATLAGRFYAMDRIKKWERVLKNYEAMVFSKGEKFKSPEEAINNAYKNNLTDEYILPSVIMKNGKPVAKISANDSVIFYNFRSDRARELAKLFVMENKESVILDKMPKTKRIKNLYFSALTGFGPDLDIHIAFPSHSISSTLPMALNNLKQLYTAEKEKYAHITYFFNGGYADPVGGEDRIVIDSPMVDSYAKVPEMSAGILTKNITQYIKRDVYDFIAVNFANADMVGHTGNLKATVKAVEFLDKQMKVLAKEVLDKNGHIIITADHGNADDMMDFGTNQPNTFHTKNPVPFLLVSEKFKNKKMRDGGVLGNIAPTLLGILEIEKPAAMRNDSLLV
jgi:2,3-bisphosphoglycerate-independent phosphoglycerate mutase